MSTLNNRTKRDQQRSGMTHEKWRANRTIHRKSAARMAHESCRVVPVSELFPSGIMRTGGTYNVGRNKAKAIARAAKRAARSSN